MNAENAARNALPYCGVDVAHTIYLGKKEMGVSLSMNASPATGTAISCAAVQVVRTAITGGL